MATINDALIDDIDSGGSPTVDALANARQRVRRLS